jgi:hypothetical protein
VTADRHCHLLRHSSTNEMPNSSPTEIVENQALVSLSAVFVLRHHAKLRFHASRSPGFAELAERPAIAEDEDRISSLLEHLQHHGRFSVQGDDSSLVVFGLSSIELDRAFMEINLIPFEIPNFTQPHSRIEPKRKNWLQAFR